MLEHPDYRNQCLLLNAENQVLRAEREELKEREANLRKQLQIIAQLSPPDTLLGSNNSNWQEEVRQLRQELLGCLNEKEALETALRGCQEKIDDLKYHNGELKSLNEKLTHLHSRELQMLKKQSVGSDQLREALREKERVERQLAEVAKVAGEMEQYYVAEINAKNNLISELQLQIDRMSEQFGGETQRIQEEQLNRQWESHLNEVREQHKREVGELRGKVKFLINKIECQQEEVVSKPSLGNISAMSAEMVQSKMVQSSASIDSFRVTQGALPASTKENLTRRNTSGASLAKTPSKYSVTHRNNSNRHPPLSQKMNF